MMTTENFEIPNPEVPETFEQLAASRRAWLFDVLKPWCNKATLIELKMAAIEWVNLAGNVDPVKTLWLWSWERFPELVHESLGIDEGYPVEVTLASGECVTGYPDGKRSLDGELYLVRLGPTGAAQAIGPWTIDEIVAVRRVTEMQ